MKLKPARILDLGRAEYGATWELQKRLVAERQAGTGVDTLVFVEHPDVITLGRRASARSNVLRDSMPVVEIERGGDATYHGPGQLVGYPILLLEGEERDLHLYLRNIEEGLIRACAELGLPTARKPSWTGTWVGDPPARKLASIGIAVRQWVTLHGFALNVSTDLSKFSAINPCGLDASVMTSMAVELGRAVTLDEVKPVVARHLGEVLGRDFAAR